MAHDEHDVACEMIVRDGLVGVERERKRRGEQGRVTRKTNVDVHSNIVADRKLRVCEFVVNSICGG
jgi:hypothetical protein